MISDAHAIPVDAIRFAALRPEVMETVETLHRELDTEIAGLSPTCWNKGECCQFGEYGHRLYVTTLEVAYYLVRERPQEGAIAPAPPSLLPILQPNAHHQSEQMDSAGDSCPHAYGGRCHARERRPLGCRIFYCDPAAQEWQGPLTERYLARLRALHEEFGIPYVYADWMVFLKALGRA